MAYPNPNPHEHTGKICYGCKKKILQNEHAWFSMMGPIHNNKDCFKLTKKISGFTNIGNPD